jgi:hypothetical protein
MSTRQQRDAMNRLAKVGPKAVAAAEARTAAAQIEAGLLSVSSVAEMIGATKIELRELVQRPEFLARIRFKKPGPDGQPGRSPLIPRELVDDLRAAYKPVEPAEPLVDEAQPDAPAEQPPPQEPHTQSGPNNQEMSLAIVYERLLSEKDARIADMRAEIEHLRSVLEREQNAHARSQALLSLQAPPPAQPEAEQPQAAADEPVVARVGESVEPIAAAASANGAAPEAVAPKPTSEPALPEAQASAATPASQSPPARRPWWKRWG